MDFLAEGKEMVFGLIKFLLPELDKPSLSWIFLVIFAGIWLYGQAQYRGRLREVDAFCQHAGEDYQQKKYVIAVEEYVDNFDIDLASRDAAISDLPNIFVTVGLIGTFIGLGIALQGAANLLSTDKIDITQLNSVLGVLAFKFKTSVWGMLLSIIYQKCYVENYFKQKDGQLCLLRGQLTEAAGKRSDLLLQDTVSGIYNGMTEYNDSKKNSDALLQDTVSGIYKGMSAYNESSDKFLKLIDSLGSILANMSNTIARHQKKYEELISQEQEWYEENMDEFKNHLKDYQDVFYRGSNTYIKNAHRELREYLGKSLLRVHDEYIKEAHCISNTIAAYNGSVNRFEEVLNEIVNKMGEIVTSDRTNQNVMQKIQVDNFEDIKMRVENIRSRILEITDPVKVNAVHNAIGSTCESLQNMAKNQGEIVGHIDAAAGKIADDNKQHLEALAMKVNGDISKGCQGIEKIEENQRLLLEKIPNGEDLRQPFILSQERLQGAIVETLQNYESNLLPLQKLETLIAALEQDKDLVRELLLRELLRVKGDKTEEDDGVTANEKKD